jgi:hypothetical protein
MTPPFYFTPAVNPSEASPAETTTISETTTESPDSSPLRNFPQSEFSFGGRNRGHGRKATASTSSRHRALAPIQTGAFERGDFPDALEFALGQL